MIFYFFTAYSLFCDPIDKFVKQLNVYIEEPEKMVLNYTSLKYQRTGKQLIKFNNYKNQILNLRTLLRNFLDYYLFGNHPYKIKDLEKYKKLNIQKVKEGFLSLKKEGKTLQTGDIIFSAPDIPYSITVKEFAQNEFGHAGIIWIKKDVPYVIQINPTIDYLELTLAEFLFPDYPKNLGFAIYKYTEKTDVVEMDYLLQQFDQNQKNIIFDSYALKNPDIKNPETYFKHPVHLYCTELLELCYKFVYNKTDLLSSFRLKSKFILNHFIKGNILLDIFFDEMDKMDEQNKNFIISPRNFIESKYFKPLIVFNVEKK